jgi:hypothetical protein
MGKIVYGNGIFLITNNSTYLTTTNFILYSSDLFNWIFVELPFFNNSKSTYINLTSNNPSTYVNITYNLFYIYGQFVILMSYIGGPYDNNIYVYNSIDGINWTINSNPLSNISYPYILNNKLFILKSNIINSYIVY